MTKAARRISLAMLLLVLPVMLALAPGIREARASVVAMNMEELYDWAYIVALGRATLAGAGEESRPDGNGSMIYRDYTFKIQKTFKGPVLSEVIVRLDGGTFGGTTMWVEDTPELTPDKDQVLFLVGAPGGKIYRTFHPMGVFTVVDNRVSNPEETLEMSVFSARMNEFKNKYGNEFLLREAQQNTPVSGEGAEDGIDLRKILIVVAPALVFLTGAALRVKYSREKERPGPM